RPQEKCIGSVMWLNVSRKEDRHQNAPGCRVFKMHLFDRASVSELGLSSESNDPQCKDRMKFVLGRRDGGQLNMPEQGPRVRSCKRIRSWRRMLLSPRASASVGAVKSRALRATIAALSISMLSASSSVNRQFETLLPHSLPRRLNSN